MKGAYGNQVFACGIVQVPKLSAAPTAIRARDTRTSPNPARHAGRHVRPYQSDSAKDSYALGTVQGITMTANEAYAATIQVQADYRSGRITYGEALHMLEVIWKHVEGMF